MTIKSNPHTHTTYVDGKSSAREMVNKALELGFEALGFSEHAYQPEIDSLYGLSLENRAKYVSEIRALQAEYAGRLRIRLGMEVDRVSPERGQELDYILAASHYFTDEGGAFAAIDGDPDKLESWVNTHFGGSWDRAIECYFDEYAAHVERVRPAIIAHFDLIRKGNLKRQWFKEDGALLSCGKEAMRRMIKACDLMELNLGGMLRSGQTLPYPTPALLKFWHDLEGKIIASTDCHNCELLGGKLDFAPEYMKDAGYEECVVLGAGEELFETRPLV